MVAVVILWSCLGWLLGHGQPATAIEKSYYVVAIEVEGLRRTNEAWLREYIDLSLPTQLTDIDLSYISQKLMTTGVFSHVAVGALPVKQQPGHYTLAIGVIEKWTTIPVVRGAVGGGTPLRIVGIYDTHSFGRLWTLGAETHKYSDAPVGYVVWARAPRWQTGKHVLGVEVWREFRKRVIYDADDSVLGEINTNSLLLRGLYMAPIKPLLTRTDDIWQAGVDISVRKEAPSYYKVADDASSQKPPQDISLESRRTVQTSVLARAVFDNIAVDNVHMRGVRFIASAGPLYDGWRMYAHAENEAFLYWMLPGRFNLALHYLVGESTNDKLISQYFLGGLDSIRGIPDGAIYGTRAAYLNAELRQLSFKFKYLWLQSAIFCDVGSAGVAWRDLPHTARTSAGVGIRLSVPQIYRLVLRIDYAWSLDRPGTHGLSAGLNELFQPYPPLK